MASFEDCVNWLRVLEATPTRPSTDTWKDPWRFAPQCSVDDVRAFEARHGVSLPVDYGQFVTQVGNGTIGDRVFSVFPLGMTLPANGDGIRSLNHVAT